MFTELMASGSGGGGSAPKVVAYAKGAAASGGSTVVYHEYDNDSDYVTVSSDHNTITFVKAGKGIFGVDLRYGRISGGTLALTEITSNNNYPDKLYSFDANVGDTIVYSPLYNGGYEVIMN